MVNSINNHNNGSNSINRKTIIDSVKNDTKEAVYKTTDLGLNSFRLTHRDIFDKIGGLNIKKHYILAQEIVKNENVTLDEIKGLIKDKNVDSNIRMEIVLAMYENKIKVDLETFSSLKSNLVSIHEGNDGVYQANTETYIYTLFMFRDGKIFKGYIEKIEKDEEKEGDFIYHIGGYKKIKSSGKVV